LDWRSYVETDPRYLRPLEVEFLQGDASKAKRRLKWESKVRFKELVRIMVDADVKALEEMRRCQDVIRQIANKTRITSNLED
jgi:GDPmannose 4,6-dehydratase